MGYIRNVLPTLAVFILVLDAYASPSQQQVDVALKVTQLLAKRDFAHVRDYLDATLKPQLSELILQGAWDALINQTGAFQGIAQTQPSSSQGYDIVEV
jgi:hypothetical protein